MATLTIYSDTGDGIIASTSTVYATARAGNGLTADAGTSIHLCGQRKIADKVDYYEVREFFISFDSTGSLAAGDTVTVAVLSLAGSSDSSDTDFTVQARTHDWGASLATGDWVAGASLSGKTLQASVSTSGWAALAYNDLTSEAGFPAAVTKNGVTYLLVSSSRTAGGNTPTGNEDVGIYSANATGTTYDPKLTITYTPAPVVSAVPCQNACIATALLWRQR